MYFTIILSKDKPVQPKSFELFTSASVPENKLERIKSMNIVDNSKLCSGLVEVFSKFLG